MSAFGSKVGPHETAKAGDPLPPVVILNLSYSGLGIARDMTRRGARVVGLSSDQKIYGNFQALFLAAVSAGIAAPKTVTVTEREQLANAGKEIGFPCVVKPISSIHWRSKEDFRTAHVVKAVRACNLDELGKEYADASKLYPGVLVQEWVAGDVDKLAVLGGYADESSELLAYFTARKIIQAPDEFGTGCPGAYKFIS
jgi:hypothetical protein